MRLYYGTYGHRLSGKLYVYWGGDNLRTGQQVVAPVTNHGKTYNTMFTIARGVNAKNAESEVERIENAGIAIKTIGGRDTLSLPGGQQFKTKKEWREDSEKRYREKFPSPAEQEQRALFKLPGGNAPKVRPTGQLKGRYQTTRESLFRNKKIPSDTTPQKDRLRSMVNKKYEDED